MRNIEYTDWNNQDEVEKALVKSLQKANESAEKQLFKQATKFIEIASKCIEALS